MSIVRAKPGGGYSIAVASRLTGIPVETLRVWERRYGFPSPSRVDGTNRRAFQDVEIDRLRWIARALSQGFRAGDVVPKRVDEIEKLLAATPREPVPVEPARSLSDVDRLIALLTSEQITEFESELRRLASALGPRRFVTDIAYPTAVAVGDAWAAGKLEVRHEHLASESLVTQLRNMLAAYQDLDGSPTVLLTTLPGEPHALGLAMIALYLAVSGARPRLLGPSTPPEQIALASKMLRADVVGLTITPVSDATQARAHLRKLVKSLPLDVDVWLGGAAATELGARLPRTRVLSSWESIDDAMAERRARKVRRRPPVT